MVCDERRHKNNKTPVKSTRYARLQQFPITWRPLDKREPLTIRPDSNGLLLRTKDATKKKSETRVTNCVNTGQTEPSRIRSQYTNKQT